MSTSPMPVVTQKKKFAFTRTRIFWASFGVSLVVNALFILAIFAAYNQGVEMGYEGEARFGWDKVSPSFGLLFGGVGSLVVTLVILALVAAALLAVHRLSARGHHTMVVVVVVLALVVGWLFFDRLLGSMAAFKYGFVPFLALVVVTALEAATIVILTTLSRKRDTH